MDGRRIGIDVRALTPPLTGIGVYCRELLRRLAELAPDNDYFCYTTRESAGENLPQGRFHLRVGTGPSALWGSVWFQSGARRMLLEDRLDLFWGPLQIVPLGLLGRVPTVVTAHDLVFHRYPETMSWRNRLLLARHARRSFRGADRLMAVSESTADAVVSDLGVDRGKIDVVHPAADDCYRPMEREATLEVCARYGIHDDYLLFVGTLEPRKNLQGLLAALSLPAREAGFDGEVVIAGARGWGRARAESLAEGHPLSDKLRFAGFVPDDDLPALYAGARIFVMPSLYEGFGLPLVEAMQSGTPVICADAPAMPEVIGDAGLVITPDDDEALATAIDRLWQDAGLRADLRERGFRRAAEFSWETTARGAIDTFLKTMGP